MYDQNMHAYLQSKQGLMEAPTNKSRHYFMTTVFMSPVADLVGSLKQWNQHTT